MFELEAGGKLSTWFPLGKLVEPSISKESQFVLTNDFLDFNMFDHFVNKNQFWHFRKSIFARKHLWRPDNDSI